MADLLERAHVALKEIDEAQNVIDSAHIELGKILPLLADGYNVKLTILRGDLLQTIEDCRGELYLGRDAILERFAKLLEET